VITPHARIEIPSIGGTVLADGRTVRLDDGRSVVLDETYLADAGGNRVELKPGDRVEMRRIEQ
jgi:hypothetical protein